MSDRSQAKQDQGKLKSGEVDNRTDLLDSAKSKINWPMISTFLRLLGLVGSIFAAGWYLSNKIGEMDGRLTEGLLRTHEDIGELQIGIERNRTEVEKTKETLTEKLHDVDKRLSIIEDKLSNISENTDSSKKAGFTVSH